MTEMEHQLVHAWQTAARDLGIRVVAPYTLTVNGREREFIALIPDFSGRNGILVAAFPFVSPSSVAAAFCAEVSYDAKSAGYGCSVFVDPKSYCTYERQLFMDVLSEWGYTGPADLRPPWLPRPPDT